MSNFDYILLSDALNCLKEMTDVRNYYLVDLQYLKFYPKINKLIVKFVDLS